MAEGLLDGLVGGEETDGEVEGAREALIEAAAFASAVAAVHAEKHTGVADATRAFLRKQARLIDVQTRHLQDEHQLRLAHLRSQQREGKLRRIGQRLRIGLQAITALVVLAIASGLGVMVYDAFSSRSVVVEAFKAPAALAGRGVTGDVVAAGVLDQLLKLQSATRGAVKSLDAHSAWSSDVKIEVPDTGVSLGEINRLLHARFGHDLHIDGELMQTDSGGLALTVRGDGVPAQTFTGAAADLDALTSKAAEYVYGRSQPLNYGVYLQNAGRWTEAVAFIEGAFPRAVDDNARADLANNWGNSLIGAGQRAAAVEKYRLAMALKPHNWKAWGNLIGALSQTQGEEATWQEARRFLQAAATSRGKDRAKPVNEMNAAQDVWDLPLQLNDLLADSRSNGGAGSTNTIDGPAIADVYAQLHDPAAAVRYMAASDASQSVTTAEAELLQTYAAVERGDGATAIAPMEAFMRAWKADPNLQFTYADNPCFLGLAYGLAGRMAEAETAFKQGGAWSRCYAFHGQVLERAGDLAGAERLWADGLKLAPDLPAIYLQRGISEMNRRDFGRATADLSTASAKAPHFADPLKAWGDLLVREGRWKEALAKYDRALKYAPNWAELHGLRDAVARRV